MTVWKPTTTGQPRRAPAASCAGIPPVRNGACPQARTDHGARWDHRVGVSGRRTGAAIGPTVCARGRNTLAARFTIEVVLAHPRFGALGQCARPPVLAILAIAAGPSGFPTPGGRSSVPREAL